jgi:hypothetical protein
VANTSTFCGIDDHGRRLMERGDLAPKAKAMPAYTPNAPQRLDQGSITSSSTLGPLPAGAVETGRDAALPEPDISSATDRKFDQ